MLVRIKFWNEWYVTWLCYDNFEKWCYFIGVGMDTILGHFGPFWHPQCQFFGNQHQNMFVTIHDGLSKTGNSGIDAEISILGSLVYAIRLHFQILGYKAFLVLTLTSRKKKLWGQKSFVFDNLGIVLFAKVWTTDFRLCPRGFQNRPRANIYIYIKQKKSITLW